MNRDRFEKAMDGLDEKLVAEAAGYKKPALRGKIIRIGSLAACAVLVLVGVVGMVSGGKKNAADLAGATAPAREGFYYLDGSDEMNQEEPGINTSGVRQYDSSAAIDNKSLSPEIPTSGQKGSAEGVQDTLTAGPDAVDPSKIIYSARLTLESKEFDKSVEAVEKIVADLGGYFEDQSVYDQGASARKAAMTIRVPQEQYQTALEQLKGVAHVTFSNQSAENVSKDYYDIQSRLDTAKVKLERLQTLLKDATDMADIIELENAISNVEWEIDYYAGSLKDYDSRIDYSTVSLELYEVLELTDTEPEPVSFGARLKNSFANGFEAIGDGIVDFVEWFVGNIIWIALIVCAVIIAVKVIKKKRNA